VQILPGSGYIWVVVVGGGDDFGWVLVGCIAC
jgi:hypothetical protein